MEFKSKLAKVASAGVLTVLVASGMTLATGSASAAPVESSVSATSSPTQFGPFRDRFDRVRARNCRRTGGIWIQRRHQCIRFHNHFGPRFHNGRFNNHFNGLFGFSR